MPTVLYKYAGEAPQHRCDEGIGEMPLFTPFVVVSLLQICGRGAFMANGNLLCRLSLCGHAYSVEGHFNNDDWQLENLFELELLKRETRVLNTKLYSSLCISGFMYA